MSAAGMAAGFQLFRPEALEAQRQAALGHILINPPLAHGIVAVTALALVAAVFAFLGLAHYTPRLRAQGVLIAAAAPAGRRLDAQLRVPAGAIAALRPGLPVRLRYAVYPYTRLRQQGTVTHIDPVPVGGAAATAPGAASRAAFYRVRVRLLPLVMNGTLPALRAGMAVRAQIVLPRRRLLAGWGRGVDRSAAAAAAPTPHRAPHRSPSPAGMATP